MTDPTAKRPVGRPRKGAPKPESAPPKPRGGARPGSGRKPVWPPGLGENTSVWVPQRVADLLSRAETRAAIIKMAKSQNLNN